MGFPEQTARDLRDALRSKIKQTLDETDVVVADLRTTPPSSLALNRGEYDRLLEYMVGARISLSNAIDRIDDSIVRQAHDHDADELARVEQEANRKE